MRCDALLSPPRSSTHKWIPSLPGSTSVTLPSPGSFTITRFRRSPYRPRFVPLRARAAVSERFERPLSELTFYELLGVERTGTLPEIKQSYKQLALKYHPDVSPPDRVDEFTERFIRVQEAYETLSDPKSRALYDRDMAKGLHLAFSARKMYKYDEVMEDKREWKNRWQNQLSELRKRSMSKDVNGNLSWGARMRRLRDES